MKGQVTTAGSQYVADTAAPAERDAKCLAAARRGNVQIVGKTNLTEFALGTSGMNEYYRHPGESPGSPSHPRRLIQRFGRRGGERRGGRGLRERYGRVDSRAGGLLWHSGIEDHFRACPARRGVPAFAKTSRHHRADGERCAASWCREWNCSVRDFRSATRRPEQENRALEQITIGRLYIDGTDPKNRSRARRCTRRGRVSKWSPSTNLPRRSGKKRRRVFGSSDPRIFSKHSGTRPNPMA